jgi:methionyl-tRNA synthetase
MNNIDYSKALEEVMALCDRANLYVEESAPWNLAKAAATEAEEAAAAGVDLDKATAPTAADRLAFVIYNILESIRIMAVLFAPTMPVSSKEVWRRLGLEDIFVIDDLARQLTWGSLPAGNTVEIGEPLFPRLKEDEL